MIKINNHLFIFYFYFFLTIFTIFTILIILGIFTFSIIFSHFIFFIIFFKNHLTICKVRDNIGLERCEMQSFVFGFGAVLGADRLR